MNLFILVFISLGTAIGSIFYIKSALVSLFKGGINNMLSGELPMLQGGGGDGKGKVKFLEKDFPTQDPYATTNNMVEQNINQPVAQPTDMKPTTGSSSNDTITSGDGKLTLNLEKEKNVDFNDETGSLIIKQKDGRKFVITGFNKLLEKKRYVKLPGEQEEISSEEEPTPNEDKEAKRREILSGIVLSDGNKLDDTEINSILGSNGDVIERSGFAQLFQGILLANPNLNLKNKDDIVRVMENVMDAFKLIDGNAELERKPRNPLGIHNGMSSAQKENNALPSVSTNVLESGELINATDDSENNGKDEEISKDEIENAVTVITNYSTVVSNSKSEVKTRNKNIQKMKDDMMKNAINLIVQEAKENPDGLKMQFSEDTLTKLIEAIENYEKNKKEKNKKKKRSNEDRYSNFLKDKLIQKQNGTEETSSNSSEGKLVAVRTVDAAKREQDVEKGNDELKNSSSDETIEERKSGV